MENGSTQYIWHHSTWYQINQVHSRLSFGCHHTQRRFVFEKGNSLICLNLHLFVVVISYMYRQKQIKGWVVLRLLTINDKGSMQSYGIYHVQTGIHWGLGGRYYAFWRLIMNKINVNRWEWLPACMSILVGEMGGARNWRLTHLPLVPHISVSEWVQHWFR